jgi:hypothetical protein
VGIIEPRFETGRRFNVYTQAWEDITGRPVLRLRTTARFRKKLGQALRWKSPTPTPKNNLRKPIKK